MSSNSSTNLKKRSRDADDSPERPNKKKLTFLPNFSPPTPSTVYLTIEDDDNAPVASNSQIVDLEASSEEAQEPSYFQELPVELLLTILRFVDIFGLDMPVTTSERHNFKREVRSFHRKDLHSARITCHLFKNLIDEPCLWASHLLLRSNAISLSGLSSMSPFRHDEATLRHVTTLLIVVEDSLASFRESKEILQFLLSNTAIQHLAIIRRTSAAETFVRSQVISDLTPTEHMVTHFCEETDLLRKLTRLTLTNVIIRPALLKLFYDNCTNFSQLQVCWSHVTLPSFEGRKTILKNESLLLSVDTQPRSQPTPPVPKLSRHNSSISSVHLSLQARALLETSPNANFVLCNLELSGSSALMFGTYFIHPLLQKIHIDFSTIAEQTEWDRLQNGFDLIPTSCPSLESFGVLLGHFAKHTSLNLGKIIVDLKTPHLTALYTDLPISKDFIPKLVDWVSFVPKLQILDLRFSNIRSNTKDQSVDTGTNNTTPQTNSSLIINAPSPVFPVFPNQQPTALPFPGFSSAIVSPNFMFNGTNMSPLANLFSNASKSMPAESTTSTPTASILTALSTHSKQLKMLRLTSSEAIAVDEEWSSLAFPSLTYLKYNLGKLPKEAFHSCETRFPKIKHLDLAHCDIFDDSSLEGLSSSIGLRHLRIEDCNARPVQCLMALFESKDACARINHLDLRVKRPDGIDAILLQRIAHSCPLLRRFAFSVLQSSTSTSTAITLRTFNTLVSKCPSLRSIQSSDRSVFTPVINDLLARHSVAIK